MSDTDAKIAKLKAEMSAKAATDKTNQDAAVKKARSAKPKTDAEIMKGGAKHGIGGGELPGEAEKVGRPAAVKAPKLGAKAKAKTTASAASPARPLAKAAKPRTVFKNLEVPQGDTRVFDFESAPKVASTIKQHNLTPDETPTDVHLAAKAQARPAPASKEAMRAKVHSPKLTIAQDVASINPEISVKPLAGQGSMEGKPVEQVTDRRGAHIERKPGGKPPTGIAERRVVPKSAPMITPESVLDTEKNYGKVVGSFEVSGGKVMTSQGSVEAVKPVPVKSVGPPKMTMEDLVQPVSHARPAMNAADIGLEGPKSLAQKVAAKAGSAGSSITKFGKSAIGKGLINFAKGVVSPITEPIAGFTSGHASRSAARSAANAAEKSATTLGERVSARAAGAAVTARTVGAVGLAGGRLALGGVKMLGEGLAAGALWDLGKAGAEAEMSSTATLNKLKSSGAKQGLQVTSETPSILRMGLGGSPHIKVVDTSRIGKPGQTLSDKRRARGENKYQANKAKGPETPEFSEADYRKLKNAANRDIIKGSYRG